MSVKHLEYVKIKDSKVLVVEVRPVKCLLDTPMGRTHTDKWMEYSHWKELNHLMMDIVEEYEEQKITQGIKYNLPKCKTGATIQIGYMFRDLPSCWCSLYFLTPRNPFNCTKDDDDDDDDGKLQDKGGRFEDFALCGEMLVISVILRDSSPSSTIETGPSPSCSGTFREARLNHKLIKALDSRVAYVNSISGYFKASTASTDDSSAKCVPSSSRGRQKSPPLRVKTSNSTSCNAEHENKGDKCSEAMKMIGSSDCDNSFNSSRSFSLKEVNSETEGEMSLLCGYNSEHAIFNETKSSHSCVGDTKHCVSVISYKNKNLENNIERPMEPAYQCSDINSHEIYNNFGSLTSESEEIFSNSESLKYQYDSQNVNNVSCSVSSYPCNSLKSVSFQPQTDVYTTTNKTREAYKNSKFYSVVDDSTLFGVVKKDNTGRSEDYCVSHEMDSLRSRRIPFRNCDENEQTLRSWEADKTDESNLNANELEVRMEGQEKLLPHKIHNDYVPETNAFKRIIQRRNSLIPDVECVSISEGCVMDAENSDLFVPVKPKDYVHKRSVLEAEVTKGSIVTTSKKNFHARSVVEEDLHHSDSAEKYFGQKICMKRNTTQECLPPKRLPTPTTDIPPSVQLLQESGSTDESSVSTQNCESSSFTGSDMQSLQLYSEHLYLGAAHLCNKNIVKEVHSSQKTLRSIKSIEITEHETLDKEQCENFDTQETKYIGQIQNFGKMKREHRSLTNTAKVSDTENEDKWMRMSFSSIFAMAGESNARKDCLPIVQKELHSDSENCQVKLLHDSSALGGSCQNPRGALVDVACEVDKQSNVQKGLEIHSIKCPNIKEAAEYFRYVGKPEMKLAFQDNVPYRIDEDVPPQITCKGKKTKYKRNIPNPELQYHPTDLRDLSATNSASCTVEDCVVQEGGMAHDIGTSEAEPVRYIDKLEMKMKFQSNAPCKAEKQSVPEKIACNQKKKKSKNMLNHELENVPTNVKHLSAINCESYSDESVMQGDATQVSGDLPLCVEEEDCVSKRKQQHIQATETCVPLFICKEKNETGNAFEEDLDVISCSTETYDSQKISDTMETPQECMPPRKMVSHLCEESYNRVDYPQSFQSCVQSDDLKREPLIMSTVFYGQEAAQERMQKNDSLKQSVRSFRIRKSTQSKYENETYMKNKSFRSENIYYDSGSIEKRNTFTDQEEKTKKKQIAGHTSASDASGNSKLCCNEKMIGKSVMEDNSFESMSSENASILSNPSPEQGDGFKGSVKKDLVHELVNISLQNSTSALITQDRTQNALHDFIQCTKGKTGESGGREDEMETKNLSTSNCKMCVQQKTAWGDNRQSQLSLCINNPKVRVTEDHAPDQECVSKGVMSPKRKRKSVHTSEKHHFPAKKRESAEKCVTQVEGLGQSGQDTVMEHLFAESSQNCTPITMYKSIRLLEENASELLQSEEHKYESGLRRSNRLKEKISIIPWLLDTSDEDLSEEHFKEKRDIAAETEKSIKFFEKYVKERNANKSVLQQKKILEYVKPCNTVEQENDCEEWSFKSTDKEKSPTSTKRKVSRSFERKNLKKMGTKKLHSKDDIPPGLIKPTTSKCDSIERSQFNVEQAALKCHKKIGDTTSHNEQREKRAKSNSKSMKDSGKRSVSKEGKKVSSPEKVVRKKVRKKEKSVNGTSSVYDRQRDLENSASASEKDALHWIIMAEMEEHDSLLSDVDTILESNQNSQNGPKTEEESGESWVNEEQPQPSEREDELHVVYSQNLASLKASYRRLQSMTESDLERRMDENLSYLEHVVLGHVPNERHEMFVSSLQQLKQQQDYLICGPFTADQTEHVLEMLKKKLSHLDRLFGNIYDVLTYRCRVLMPTFLTKIVMDNENVSLKKAEELMIKFSLDQNITGTPKTRDWRKF